MTNQTAIQDWQSALETTRKGDKTLTNNTDHWQEAIQDGLLSGELKVDSYGIKAMYEIADLAAMLPDSRITKEEIFRLISTHSDATVDDHFRVIVFEYDLDRRNGRPTDAEANLLSLKEDVVERPLIAQIEYLQALAQCRYVLKDFTEAVKLQEQLMELVKQDETLSVRKRLYYIETMASLYLDANQTDEPFQNCLQQYQMTMRSISPHELWYHRVYSDLYFLKGRYAQRKSDFQAAADLFAEGYRVAQTNREKAVNALMSLYAIGVVNDHLADCLGFLREHVGDLQPTDMRILDKEFKEVATKHLGLRLE